MRSLLVGLCGGWAGIMQRLVLSIALQDNDACRLWGDDLQIYLADTDLPTLLTPERYAVD